MRPAGPRFKGGPQTGGEAGAESTQKIEVKPGAPAGDYLLSRPAPDLDLQRRGALERSPLSWAAQVELGGGEPDLADQRHVACDHSLGSEVVISLNEMDADLCSSQSDQRVAQQAVILAAIVAVDHVGELVSRGFDGPRIGVCEG